MGFLLTVALSTCMAQMSEDDPAAAERRVLYFSCKVLDKSGTPVPNAKITLVAVTKEGKSHGLDAEWSTGMGTNHKGLGKMGFGTPPKIRPGKLHIVARHPSIQEVRKTVEWSDVLHERWPSGTFGKPMFVLKSEGGLGQAAWRDSVAKRAPILCKSLLEATDEKDIDAITEELVAGEMMSISPMVAVLQDYKNPRRSRFLRAFMRNNYNPLDPAMQIKAFAIRRVNSYAALLRMQPEAKPMFLRKIPDEAVLPVAREVAWVIKDLEAKIRAARQAEDPDRIVGNLTMVLSRMREVEKQVKALRRKTKGVED